MIDYIQGMLDKLPHSMAAMSHLFQVNEDAQKLDESTGQLFHHNIAKLLFLCKCARTDI
jgi:hypothetical protein